MTDTAIWTTIIALGLGTFLIRFSFMGLVGSRELPPWLTRHLRYVPVAVLPGLVAPLVVGVAAILLGIPEEMREVALFQAAMPPIVAGAVLLIAQGLAPRYAVSVLGFGTLIALAYLPVLAWIIRLT